MTVRTLFLTLGVLVACHRPTATPPRAEFLVLAGDSTFWVHSGPEGVRSRGSPLRLARYGGRFYELYLVDDDRSYSDALIIGQQFYRRSILSGDSAVVFDDTTISGIARWYGRSHPSDRPLEDDDEAPTDPHVSATSDFSVLSEHGPFVSFEYRADLSVSGSEQWHVARRGVIDLRDGRQQPVADLFGERNGGYVVRRGRALFTQTLDSILASRDSRAKEAVSALGDFVFDSMSFSIETLDHDPAVAFAVPGRGTRAGGLTLPLPAIRVAAPSWWSDAQEGSPNARDDGRRVRWVHGSYQVATDSDASSDAVRLTIVDTTGRQWRVTSLPSVPTRIYWLDRPAVDSATRRALERAFDEAALYSDESRTAMFYRAPTRGATRVRPASLSPALGAHTLPHHPWNRKHHANPRRSLRT